MNIVYSCSKQFVPLLLKSIASVKKFNPLADIYIVCKEDIDCVELRAFGIKYLSVKQDRRISVDGTIPQWWEGNAKLFFTQLPLSKIIYLGADTICQGSLAEVWAAQCDYISACKSHSFGDKQAKDLGLKFYINVDFMVMNLDALRADNFTEKAFAKQDFKTKPWCNEETLINGNFHSKIKLLPQKYNYAFNRTYSEPLNYKDAVILHFIGRENKQKMMDFK